MRRRERVLRLRTARQPVGDVSRERVRASDSRPALEHSERARLGAPSGGAPLCTLAKSNCGDDGLTDASAACLADYSLSRAKPFTQLKFFAFFTSDLMSILLNNSL